MLWENAIMPAHLTHPHFWVSLGHEKIKPTKEPGRIRSACRRHLPIPVINKGYLYYTTIGAQSIPHDLDTTILFTKTTSARNVAINGLTFNSTTGLFTNNSGSTLNLSISYSVGFYAHGVGVRAIWIKHSILKNVARMQISSIVTPLTTHITIGETNTVISTSGVFSLLNGETFECRCFQSSGGALTIVNTVAYPTVIHICQL